MCEHGDTVTLNVLVPADLAFEGVDTWKDKPVDRCIAPLVQALNHAGILTRASCCGHAKRPGNIALADGRELIVVATFEEARRLDVCTHDERVPSMSIVVAGLVLIVAICVVFG